MRRFVGAVMAKVGLRKRTNMLDIREQAKQYARQSLHFEDRQMNTWIEQAIDTMPLTLVGMPYCRACESVLCGVCGDCHSFDLKISDPECPNDNDTAGSPCIAWWQGLKAVITAQRQSEQK
jgi:hypothetical protein